jgi:hypothetical protein
VIEVIVGALTYNIEVIIRTIAAMVEGALRASEDQARLHQHMVGTSLLIPVPC